MILPARITVLMAADAALSPGLLPVNPEALVHRFWGGWSRPDQQLTRIVEASEAEILACVRHGVERAILAAGR